MFNYVAFFLLGLGISSPSAHGAFNCGHLKKPADTANYRIHKAKEEIVRLNGLLIQEASDEKTKLIPEAAALERSEALLRRAIATLKRGQSISTILLPALTRLRNSASAIQELNVQIQQNVRTNRNESSISKHLSDSIDSLQARLLPQDLQTLRDLVQLLVEFEKAAIEWDKEQEQIIKNISDQNQVPFDSILLKVHSFAAELGDLQSTLLGEANALKARADAKRLEIKQTSERATSYRTQIQQQTLWIGQNQAVLNENNRKMIDCTEAERAERRIVR